MSICQDLIHTECSAQLTGTANIATLLQTLLLQHVLLCNDEQMWRDADGNIFYRTDALSAVTTVAARRRAASAKRRPRTASPPPTLQKEYRYCYWVKLYCMILMHADVHRTMILTNMKTTVSKHIAGSTDIGPCLPEIGAVFIQL
jgi:hypothetical protein